MSFREFTPKSTPDEETELEDKPTNNQENNQENEYINKYSNEEISEYIEQKKYQDLNQTQQTEENLNSAANSGKSSAMLNNKPNNKPKWSIGRKISFTIILMCVFLVIIGSISVFIGGNKISNVFVEGGGIDLGQLFTGQRAELQGEKEGRTNILLIGRDTEANLADTLIVASYYHKEGKMATISLPRDFLINDGYSTTKINAIYAYAEQRYSADQSEVLPERFMADVIGKELNIPIHYWSSINFDGVEKLVDTVGGIDVNVENSFYDCMYPDKDYDFLWPLKSCMRGLPPDCAKIHPCPKFEAGPNKMDGATALVFARSRYSYDNPAEAIDFARSRRQQLVIQAVIDKIKQETKSGNLVLNPGKLNEYLTVLGNNVKTSIKPNEVLSLYQIFKEKDQITSQKYRFAADYDSGIMCPKGVSDIIYCDNSIGGSAYAGNKKIELQNIAKNLLPYLETQDLIKTPVEIVGNLSDLTPTAQKEFQKLGFSDIKYTNKLQALVPATSTSVEKATIYFANPTIKTQFEVSQKPAFEFTVGDQIPAEISTAGYGKTGILVVVKTVEKVTLE